VSIELKGTGCRGSIATSSLVFGGGAYRATLLAVFRRLESVLIYCIVTTGPAGVWTPFTVACSGWSPLGVLGTVKLI